MQSEAALSAQLERGVCRVPIFCMLRHKAMCLSRRGGDRAELVTQLAATVNRSIHAVVFFMRNIGGSIGTSGLSVFLAHQNQTHQVTLASHTNMANPNFRQFLNGLTALFLSQGYDAATAGKKAMSMAYFTLQSQANALSFKNSFFVMSVIIACLSPLPFIMRRPKQGERQPSAAH